MTSNEKLEREIQTFRDNGGEQQKQQQQQQQQQQNGPSSTTAAAETGTSSSKEAEDRLQMELEKARSDLDSALEQVAELKRRNAIL